MTSNILVPYTFTPGTKAKASEVNANFEALAVGLGEVASTTDNKINESVAELDAKIDTKTDPYLTDTVRMTNCILEAPNGVANAETSTITVFEGLKVLISDGRNSDNTLKSKTVTLDEDISVSTAEANGKYYLLMDERLNLTLKLRTEIGYNYLAPNTNLKWLYYDEVSNYWMITTLGSAYEVFKGIILAEFNCSSGVISDFKAYRSANLVKHSDIVIYLKTRHPNYSAGIGYAPSAMNQVQYAPCDGILLTNIVSRAGEWTTFYINGVSLGQTHRTTAYLTRFTGAFLLSENDTFYTSLPLDAQFTVVYFFPLKGVSL